MLKEKRKRRDLFNGWRNLEIIRVEKETYCHGGIGAEELGDELDFFG